MALSELFCATYAVPFDVPVPLGEAEQVFFAVTGGQASDLETWLYSVVKELG